MPAKSTVNPACAEMEGRVRGQDGWLSARRCLVHKVKLTTCNTLKAIYVHAFHTGMCINNMWSIQLLIAMICKRQLCEGKYIVYQARPSFTLHFSGSREMVRVDRNTTLESTNSNNLVQSTCSLYGMQLTRMVFVLPAGQRGPRTLAVEAASPQHEATATHLQWIFPAGGSKQAKSEK